MLQASQGGVDRVRSTDSLGWRVVRRLSLIGERAHKRCVERLKAIHDLRAETDVNETYNCHSPAECEVNTGTRKGGLGLRASSPTGVVPGPALVLPVVPGTAVAPARRG